MKAGNRMPALGWSQWFRVLGSVSGCNNRTPSLTQWNHSFWSFAFLVLMVLLTRSDTCLSVIHFNVVSELRLSLQSPLMCGYECRFLTLTLLCWN